MQLYFKGSIEEIHHPEEVPGHPIYTMRQENKAIEEHIENVINLIWLDLKEMTKGKYIHF